MLFFPAIILSIIIFIISDSVSYFLFESYNYTVQIKIISAAIPFIVLNTILEGYLRGLKLISIYVKVIIITNVINLFIILPLVYFFGLNGALTGILFSNVIYIIVSYYYLSKKELIMRKEFRLNFDSALFNKILKVSFVFLVSGALFQFTLILLRKLIITNFGIYFNGIYQSVIGISLNYFGIIFLSLATYSFPTVSKLHTNSELNNELNVNVKYIIYILVPLILLIYTFRKLVISILFSSDFIPAENFFRYQFLGDYFKALAWALGIWLVPKLKLKIFLLLELILNINLIVISFLFLNVFKMSIEMISLAYLISYLIHFVLNYHYTKKILNFTLLDSIKKIFLVSFLILIPVILISDINDIAGYILIVPVLILWFSISIDKYEKNEIKNFILSKTGMFKN